ncbi:sodium-dependent phosphate transport protein 2B-like isoform X3 [Ornithodoros turicata]
MPAKNCTTCTDLKSAAIVARPDTLDVEVKIKMGDLGSEKKADINGAAVGASPCLKPQDPWALPELQDQGVKWSDLGCAQKFQRVFLGLAKALALLALLYLFICSLDFLSSAFRLVGGKTAGKVMSQNEVLKNPVVGLMIGLLSTVLVQSSSTSSSIIITMVGAGLVEVRDAIPIIMGANIGTSVTNTIVSLMQSSERNEFRRAFAAATVHDMFNWLTVIILLPLEAAFGLLYHLTSAIVDSTEWTTNKHANRDFLQVITKPFTGLIIKLDKKVIQQIAIGDESYYNRSLIKRCCKKTADGCIEPCEFALQGLQWQDSFIGILLLGISLLTLCTCLILMVKLLHSMLGGRISVIIKTTVNAEYRFPYSILVGYIGIGIGCFMTILVQSSSLFTSALTPLAGIGVISLERIYPLTLGANVGTTTTGILAALAADAGQIRHTLQIAFCHLFFNLIGILVFYPIPYTRLPIHLAKMLGNTIAEYRWFSLMYLICMFILFPAAVFGLSMAGMVVFMAVLIPVFLLLVAVIVINVLQRKAPRFLPECMRTWMWLPEWMRSLEPLDRIVHSCVGKIACCQKICPPQNAHNGTILPIREEPSQMNFVESRRSSYSTGDWQSDLQGIDNSAFDVTIDKQKSVTSTTQL